MNIMLTAVGGPSGICFAKSLRAISGVRLIGTSADGDAFGEPLVEKVYRVPFANDSEYLPAIRDIVVSEHIDYIVPLVDEEVAVLSEAEGAIGCKIFLSPKETIRYTNDKAKAYERLSAYLPNRFDPADVEEYPIFAKPRIGRGGKGATVVNSREELMSLPAETHIFQEFLQGPEVSVDGFFDFGGALVVAVPRIRAVIDQGISVSGDVFYDESLKRMIISISSDLKFVGPINFQFMRRGDEYRLTEINARGSGGMGITIRAGADMPKLSYELMRDGHIEHAPDVRMGTYSNFEEVIERQRRKLAQAS